MSRNDLNDPTLSRLSKAANWLQCLHQSPVDELLLEKCQRWLHAAPENARAFERMETVWQAFGQLATKSHAAPSPVRRCVAATMPPVKQQLPRPVRL